MSKKANNWKISQKFLDFRSPKNPEFKKQKWIEFCEALLKEGLSMKLYEARKTSSKYITIYFKNQQFKVRFSDHKPIKSREKLKDCDFFVGVSHFNISTTKDALLAVKKWKESLESLPDTDPGGADSYTAKS